MKTIMLVCSAGMSTSLLVTKMKKAAEEQNIDVEVFAVSEAESKNYAHQANVVLLGPQVRYILEKMKAMMAFREVPVAVINSADYGMMNGKAVLKQALDLMK